MPYTKKPQAALLATSECKTLEELFIWDARRFAGSTSGRIGLFALAAKRLATGDRARGAEPLANDIFAAALKVAAPLLLEDEGRLPALGCELFLLAAEDEATEFKADDSTNELRCISAFAAAFGEALGALFGITCAIAFAAGGVPTRGTAANGARSGSSLSLRSSALI